MANTVFFDFDSTLITKESLDEVLKLALKDNPHAKKIIKKVEEITNLGMDGVLNFNESLKRRLTVTQLHKKHFEIVGENLIHAITPGMSEIIRFLQKNNHQVFVISGGFLDSIYPVSNKFNISRTHCFANDYFTDDNGNITGLNENIPLCHGNGKSLIIEQLKKEGRVHGKTIMIGDGSNDLKVYEDGLVDIFCGFGVNVVRN